MPPAQPDATVHVLANAAGIWGPLFQFPISPAAGTIVDDNTVSVAAPGQSLHSLGSLRPFLRPCPVPYSRFDADAAVQRDGV